MKKAVNHCGPLLETILLVLLGLVLIAGPTSGTQQVTFSFKENTGPDYSVGRVTEEQGTNFRFSGGSTFCSQNFSIVSGTGEILTSTNIDREFLIQEIDDDTLSCSVTYSRDGQDTAVQVKFHVLDVNDFTPYFSGMTRPVDTRKVYENVQVGQVIAYLMPFDLDAGPNGTVNFTILHGNEGQYFNVSLPAGQTDTQDRLIILNQKLDYTTHPQYNLTLSLSDGGSPPLTSTQYLVINIIDVNDQAPAFSEEKLSFNVSEDHPVGSSYPFAVIGATDDDSPTHSQIFYQLDLDGSTDAYAIADLLAVNTTSGELYLINKLEYDGNPKHSYKFQVEARNPGTAIGTKAIVTLNVTDANDEVPILNCLPEEINVYENSSTFFIFCSFEDSDEAPQDKALGKVNISSWPIELDHKMTVTHLSPNSPYFIHIAFNDTFDREETPNISINITASDSGVIPLSSSQVINVTVLDINDNPPQFTTTGISSKISISSQPPLAIASVHATDPDEGSNSVLRYSLTSIEPATAADWFIINNDTGLISLVESPTEGIADVYITVRCSDRGYPVPLHNSTVVHVHITQPVTYRPISYQQYNNINLASSNVVYIEFHTMSSNGLLLYQSHSIVKNILWISNDTVFYNDGLIRSSGSIGKGRWYSLLLNKTEGTLLVWEKGSDSPHSVTASAILETSRVRDCSAQRSTPNSHSLFVGGVPDAFNVLPSLLTSSDFIGSISAVVIGNQHLDLSCPYSSRSTVQGHHYNTQCMDTDLCSDRSDCVPYTPTGSSPCYCTNGLPTETCDTDQDYGPIAITNESYIQFDLDYNFFYTHSKFLSEQNQQQSQSISVSFIHDMTQLSGVILYSRTNDGFIQRLEINKTIRYTVTQHQMPKLSLITEEFSFRKGIEYTLELILSLRADDMRIKVTEKDSNSPGQYLEVTTKNFSHQSEFYAFAKEPGTVISLGGLSPSKGGVYQRHYTGCITEFKIDSEPLPLVGIMTSNSLNYTSKEGLQPYCHSCYMHNTCTAHSSCIPQDRTNYQCHCDNGYTMINNTCVQVSSTVSIPSSSELATIRPSNIPWTGGVENPTESGGFKLYYIISISGGLVLLVAVLLVVLAVLFRCVYKRGRKEREVEGQTQPSPHGNGCYTETTPTDKGNSVQLKRGNNYVKTSILKNHGQSSTDDIDSSSDMIPYTFGCRKSTSQETGFHTASEPEGPSSRSSPRRESMMSKESERYSSDFTSLETDSEDLTTSGIDEIMSPNEVRLVSSGSMMGVPSSFRLQHPLTPTEKTLLKPLQPSSSLTLSEDETDTEVSTSSPRRRDPPTGRYYEGRGYFDNDSLASNQNSPKWYKTSSPSTIIDSDSESINNGLLSGSLTRLSSFPKGGRGNRHKSHRPPNLLPHVRPHKGTSPHHSPFVSSPGYSSSPLVKSHRLAFDYPSMATSAITPAPPTYHPPHPPHGLYYDHTEARLPSIAESVQYQPRPYHPRPHEHIDPYYTGYQGVALTPGGGAPTAYCDLNSFSKVNPITYWEGQQRLHPIVDQDDPLRFLREPCRKFEDVSTTPSVAESGFTESVVADRDSTVSEPQGRNRPVTSRGVHNDYVVMPRTLPPHPTNEEEAGYHDNNQRSYMEERRGYHSNDDQVNYRDNVHIVDRRGYHSDDAGLNGYHGNMNGAREEEITHFPSADCTSTLATNTLATSVPPVALSNGGSERQYQ
ncbi:PREDICTED: uncharacterized protein LOC105313586 [Amphimedon queenslandica]|nr:PREDICTED: uncharacterized protein LOC105313586 [Amphimedon queenslandica]|eukprot:XP_011405435.2 PREDICTED: uncharacterized protein LOC105313586 [Amphimedon queenslandica]